MEEWAERNVSSFSSSWNKANASLFVLEVQPWGMVWSPISFPIRDPANGPNKMGDLLAGCPPRLTSNCPHPKLTFLPLYFSPVAIFSPFICHPCLCTHKIKNKNQHSSELCLFCFGRPLNFVNTNGSSNNNTSVELDPNDRDAGLWTTCLPTCCTARASAMPSSAWLDKKCARF